MMKKLLSIVLVLAMVLGFADVSFAADYTKTSAVVYFDGVKKSTINVIHCSDSNEYPCVSLLELGDVIGGTVSGNTLQKDKVTITFTEGSRIANYTHADYPNRADYMTTYYTNTSNILTGESSNKLASVATSLIPGETADKSLSADYTNDGTDGTNDGYILEYAPFKDSGMLYVPLYCVVPTLNYHVEYFRFDSPKKIEITTGAKELSDYQTFYAKDYGAKGDGVTDDKDAILKGFYDAVMYEGPSKFVLEAGKTYRVSERVDFKSFFYLYGKDNFMFDGKGSTILFSTPVNGAVETRSCKNIIFKDITFMYDEHTSTHGQIESVGTNSFVMKIAETVEVPANKEWMDNTGGKTYGFGQAYDLDSKHPKFITPDNFSITNIEDLGNKRIKVTLSNQTSNSNGCALEVGDGFVINNRSDGYDTGERTAGITLFLSKDIELNGVTLCGSHVLGVAVGLCEGNITFRNYKMRTKDGAATASSADGIHCYRNRATVLIEDSELWNNLDDHINTKGEYARVTSISDNNTITVSMDQRFKPGDEIVFMERTVEGDIQNTTKGKAYVTSVSSSGTTITLDRAVPTDISNLVTTPQTGKLPVMYNIMASAAGTCIRGTKFIASRRHAYISRSRNSIFMNNYVQNNGGSTCDASDEIGTSEGPFPDSFTIRNNRTYGDGITESSAVPSVIAVRAYRNPGAYDTDTTQREINGALIQGNIVQVNTGRCTFFLNSVKDLYMSNNQILWNSNWNGTEYNYKYTNYKPVYISNCEIKEFKNLTYGGPSVSTVVTTKNCTGSVSSNEIH